MNMFFLLSYSGIIYKFSTDVNGSTLTPISTGYLYNLISVFTRMLHHCTVACKIGFRFSEHKLFQCTDPDAALERVYKDFNGR
jgi:hypothetical protein